MYIHRLMVIETISNMMERFMGTAYLQCWAWLYKQHNVFTKLQRRENWI